jgi:hypothetical protein
MGRSALHPDWGVEFDRWAERFTEPLRHKVRRKWARAHVRLLPAPRSSQGARPSKHPVPSVPSVAARDFLAPLTWRRITWRRGTKGALRAQLCAVRVRVADGPKMARAQHLPGGEEVWLIGERRKRGETKYHLSNPPAKVSRLDLARLIKARWVCEQPRQQMKQELGLDHCEGRSRQGLHHHVLLCQIAYAFLQPLRLGDKRNGA